MCRQLPAKRSATLMAQRAMAHACAARSRETHTTRKPITGGGLPGAVKGPGIAATTARKPIVSQRSLIPDERAAMSRPFCIARGSAVTSATSMRVFPPSTMAANSFHRTASPFLIFSQQSSDIRSLNSNHVRRDKRCSEFATYREGSSHEQPKQSYSLQERHHHHDGS